MSRNIPILAAKRIAKDYGYDQVIVYGRDTETGREHMTTYGTTKAKCDAVGKIASTMQKFMDWSGGDVGAFLRHIMPAVLRPGMYTGKRYDRTDYRWRLDAVNAYPAPERYNDDGSIAE